MSDPAVSFSPPDSSGTFEAFVVDRADPFFAGVRSVPFASLPPGEVLIKVAYSSVNYKDALACLPEGKIVKRYPFVPGVDLSGIVVSSADSRFAPGQAVLATGYDIGVSHEGGFAQYARLSGEWIVPLPAGLSLREAMIFGTAGFTAALSIERLEENGMRPEQGKVLVTGATGGVGGAAVAMLARKGYEVAASTGKRDAADYLRELGAAEVISRADAAGTAGKPLDKQLWQAAVDPVGGAQLAGVLSRIVYGGSVAVSGLTGGIELPTSVLPFILRGVNLLGIDSVYCQMEQRMNIWGRLAGDLKPAAVDRLVDREIALAELPAATADVLASRTCGRIVVRVAE